MKNETKSLEDRLRAIWNSSPALRAEFGGDYERCMAYNRAVTAGKIKPPWRNKR